MTDGTMPAPPADPLAELPRDAALRENLIEALLDAIPELFFVLDRDGRVLRLNRVLPEKMNLPRVALHGHSIFDALPPDVAANRRAHADRVFASGEPLVYEDRHGSWYFRHRLRPVRNAAGDTVAVAVYVVEVTRELAVERKLAEQGRRLEQAGKLEGVGLLAGGVAHDFNNTLTGILGNLYLARRDLPADSPAARRLDAIESFALGGAKLTRQLLGYARGGKYDVTVFDAGELVRHTVEFFGRTRRGLECDLEVAPGTPDLEADRSQIQQVLMNLFLNAADAMGGGGRLAVRVSGETVDLEGARSLGVRPGPFVRVEVADTGCGMDGETLERAFDPFFTTKDPGAGTGLGLASALGIARNHDGALTATSEPGKGSTFTLRLPASTRARPAAEAPVPAPATRGAGTILVVDDDRAILGLTVDLLASLGYEPLAAGSGSEALEIFHAHRHRIGLVLQDIVMPGTTAASLVREMRRARPDLPVLLVSGFSRHGEADDLLKAGCAGYLQKPYAVADLAAKIRAALKQPVG